MTVHLSFLRLQYISSE